MITRSVKGSLGLAALLIFTTLGLSYASRIGWIDPDTVTRATQALIGLILALFGNATGKLAPGEAARAAEKPALMAARRFFGLALVLGGLGHAAAWLFMPLDWADLVSMGVVILALLAGLARIGWSLRSVDRPMAGPH